MGRVLGRGGGCERYSARRLTLLRKHRYSKVVSGGMCEMGVGEGSGCSWAVRRGLRDGREGCGVALGRGVRDGRESSVVAVGRGVRDGRGVGAPDGREARMAVGRGRGAGVRDGLGVRGTGGGGENEASKFRRLS